MDISVRKAAPQQRITTGTTWLEGGIISINVDNTKFDVSAGNGEIVDSYTNPLKPIKTKVTWNAFTAVVPTEIAGNDDTIIYIDEDGEIFQKSGFTIEDQRPYIAIGSIIHPNRTTIDVATNTVNATSLDLNLALADFSFKFGPISTSGNVYSANGANVKLNKTAGEILFFGANAKTSIKKQNVFPSPAATPVTFFHTWQDGASSFNASGPITDLNTSRYDDGTGGTTQPDGVMSPNYWQIFRVFQGSGVTVIHYGQEEYSRKVDALSSIGEEIFNRNPRIDLFPIICWIAVKQGATALSNDNQAIFMQKERPQEAFNKAIPQLNFKSYTFTSRGVGAGTYYQGGYYFAPAADANLDEGSTTVVLGTANISYAAHAFLVAGGIGTVDTGTVEIEVSGTSINDSGVRTPGDSQIIVADIAQTSLNEYFETSKKWLGQITYTLQASTGAPTTFALDFNYGFAKYEDFGNRNFKLTDFEVVGYAGASDTAFEIRLLKHSSTGWIYSAAAFAPGDSEIAVLTDTHGAESDLSNKEQFAFKYSNLDTDISGSASEGVIIETTTGANNSVQVMDMHIGVEV